MRKLLLALTAVVLCACATVSDIPAQSTLTLMPGADGALGRRAALRFDGILDSRCPANVKCVWAGKIAYRFTLTGGAAAETFLLDHNRPSHASTELAGVTVVLQAASPPPASHSGQPPVPHPVTLTVQRRPQ